MGKYILIIGGELFNKGAEAMSFATVSEMKKKFPEKEVILLSTHDYNRVEEEKNKFNFKILPFDNDMIYQLLGGSSGFLWNGYTQLKKSSKSKFEYLLPKMKTIFEDVHAMIDISGYALSSQWGIKRNVNYLATINLARKKNIPFYIMPQSIGPFDFGPGKQLVMDRLIKQNLSYPEVVYTREMEGYNLLTQKYNLTNVVHSPDLVLLNKETDLSKIYHEVPVIDDYSHVNGVGIAPNMRNFDHGDYENILETYRSIINLLLEKEMNVYLFRHAYEDIEVCRMIKDMFPKEEKVVLIEEELKSYEFNELVTNFKFLIGSRYHSIIHAYKHGVPSIALGWATKYRELLNMFDQNDYIFDVRHNIDTESILNAVNQINEKHEIESQSIQEKLISLQGKNIFDVIE